MDDDGGDKRDSNSVKLDCRTDTIYVRTMTHISFLITFSELVYL